MQGPTFAMIGAWLIYQIQSKDVIPKEVADSLFQKAIITTALGFLLSIDGTLIDDWWDIYSMYYDTYENVVSKYDNNSFVPYAELWTVLQDSLWSSNYWNNIRVLHLPHTTDGWCIIIFKQRRRHHDGSTKCWSLQISSCVQSLYFGVGVSGLVHRTTSKLFYSLRQVCIDTYISILRTVVYTDHHKKRSLSYKLVNIIRYIVVMQWKKLVAEMVVLASYGSFTM